MGRESLIRGGLLNIHSEKFTILRGFIQKRRRRGDWKSYWYTGFHAWRLHYCARATVAKPQWRNGCCARWVFEKGGPESVRRLWPTITPRRKLMAATRSWSQIRQKPTFASLIHITSPSFISSLTP